MTSRIMLSMTFVVAMTFCGGLLGGWAGREIGRLSPDFVKVMAFGTPERARPDFQPDRFGLGLGAACGLFFGAGASLILVVIHVAREVWLAKYAARKALTER